ncbi:MAG TPA: surface-adhesin E family protein [Usitatibacter sp.]|jgi:hypothetical protein|nr:surface-adhesin E family protein [Usitatibacter sp.]
MLRKTLVAPALMMLCAGAHAEWKLIKESPFGAMSYDPASVHADQGRTRMQYRLDFPAPRKNAQGKTYLSATMDVRVDCGAQTINVVDLRTNAGSKGQGEVVDRQTLPPAPGEKISQSSSNVEIYKVACPGSPIPEKPAASATSAPPAAPAKAPAAPGPAAKK